MAAPNIETIFQFEDAIEAAAESILTNAASLTGYRQRDADVVATPCAAVQLSGVNGLNRQYKTGSNVFNWPSDFTATLTVTVTTNRQENAASHSSYLGKVRRHFYELTNWTDERLPHLKIVSMQEQGSSPQFTDDERFDQTALTFRVGFFIKDTAWP